MQERTSPDDDPPRPVSVPNILQLDVNVKDGQHGIFYSVLSGAVSESLCTSTLQLDAISKRGVVRLDTRRTSEHGLSLRCLHKDCDSKKNVVQRKDDSKRARLIFKCDHETALHYHLLDRSTGLEDVLQDIDFSSSPAEQDAVIIGARPKTFTQPTDTQTESEERRVLRGGWMQVAKGQTLLLPDIRTCICRTHPCTCDARCGVCDSSWDTSSVAKTVHVTLYRDHESFSIPTAGYYCSKTGCNKTLQWDGDTERVAVAKTMGTSLLCVECIKFPDPSFNTRVLVLCANFSHVICIVLQRWTTRSARPSFSAYGSPSFPSPRSITSWCRNTSPVVPPSCHALRLLRCVGESLMLHIYQGLKCQ